MSGYCYGCGTAFSVFKKERGCKNCGAIFCKGCLGKKAPIPKKNNEKHSVCAKCFDILTGKVNPSEPAWHSPPEAYKKRIAAQNDPEHVDQKSQSAISRKGGNIPVGGGPNTADRDIAQRLSALKQQHRVSNPVPSEKDLTTRLARLKGENVEPAITGTKQQQQQPHMPQPPHQQRFYQPPETRTQQEQSDNLFDEIMDEVLLDENMPDSTKQMEERLSHLKHTDVDKIRKGNDTAGGAQHGNETDDSVINNLNASSGSQSKVYDKNIPPECKPSSETKPRNDEDISLEEMNRLINNASKEMEADAQKALHGLQQDKEIMERLEEIKKRKQEKGTEHAAEDEAESDEENEDQATQRILKQLDEERQLDEAASQSGIQFSPTKLNTGASAGASAQGHDQHAEYVDPDELPWCCICNEDASLRCKGCDMDLYCDKCYKEGHDKFMMTDHVTTKYVRPKMLQGI